MIRRLRDEAHRFALTYHRELRARRIRDSALDEVEGIGAKRKEQLLKEFGSVARLRRATEEQIATYEAMDAAAFADVRAMLGLDQVEVAITGAAPIPARPECPAPTIWQFG
jgi:excinuclease ABC subunit C